MIDPGSNRTIVVVLTALAAVLFGSFGCGGTMAFSDSSSLVVVGDPPPPPEPEPPPPPPPPKRVEVTADQIVIKEKIQFEVDKADIRSESHDLLNEIVSVIKENAHIRKISIEGHTDSDGSNKYNKKLSDSRAASVLKYLTEHGIEADRLSSKGFGEEKPIASNDTAEGKEKNRRVEFLIVEQGEVKKTFEIDPKTGERREVGSKVVDGAPKQAAAASQSDDKADDKAGKKEDKK
ncbi:MAG: OmpA family protein [Myxococcales bacterium]|nr:OmpA family protein [Myxococcales bacterium]